MLWSIAVTLWEYSAIDLNDLPRKTLELDLLNNAGAEGWELVAISNLNIAILKRPRTEKMKRAAAVGARQGEKRS